MTATMMPTPSPSHVLFGRDPRRQRRRADRAAAEVGAGVAEERADEDVDHDRVAVRQVAQHDRVADRQADPEDPQHRHRDRRRAAAALGHARGRTSAGNARTVASSSPERLAVVRRQRHPDQRQEARQPRWMRAVEHRVELVQADDPERDQPDREDQAARPTTIAMAKAIAGTRARRSARRQVASRCCGAPSARPCARLAALSAPRTGVGARAYSSSEASKASREKSGQSSSRNTSSLYALCHSR